MTIKSQDELPQTGRDNSTLIEVISKLETTTKQLEIAVEALEKVRNVWLENKPMYSYVARFSGRITKIALEKIKELEK